VILRAEKEEHEKFNKNLNNKIKKNSLVIKTGKMYK
jgi:hypothetical protein